MFLCLIVPPRCFFLLRAGGEAAITEAGVVPLCCLHSLRFFSYVFVFWFSTGGGITAAFSTSGDLVFRHSAPFLSSRVELSSVG